MGSSFVVDPSTITRRIAVLILAEGTIADMGFPAVAARTGDGESRMSILDAMGHSIFSAGLMTNEAGRPVHDLLLRRSTA